MKKITDLNVLVVDDVKTVRSILVKTLKAIEINNITEADSSPEAIKYIQQQEDEGTPVDIIFSDWNMPGGDGIELLEQIRSHKSRSTRLMKFVMVTSAENKVLEAMDKGANNVIHKPFDEKLIYKKIELMFGI